MTDTNFNLVRKGKQLLTSVSQMPVSEAICSLYPIRVHRGEMCVTERAGSARKHNIYKTYLREWKIGSIRLFESLQVQRNDTEYKLLWLTVKYVIVYSNAFQNKRLNVRITLTADCLYIRLCCLP